MLTPEATHPGCRRRSCPALGRVAALTMTAVPCRRAGVSRRIRPALMTRACSRNASLVRDDTLLVRSMHVVGSWRELGEAAWEPT